MDLDQHYRSKRGAAPERMIAGGAAAGESIKLSVN
jgi:hypothetical protein